MASVASRNLFDLLGESEDADSIKEKEPSAKEPPVVKKKVDRTRAHPQEKGIRFDYPQRGGHKGPTSNRNEDTRSAAPRDRNVGPRLSGRNEEGGGGVGGRGGDYPARNSRGARPGDRDRGRGRGRRGREFDRHSGTGKYDSEKKENQGWGSATESWQNNNTVETTTWSAETNDNAAAASTWNDNANDTAGTGSWAENTTEEKNEWSAGATDGATEEKDKDTWGGATEDTTESNKWNQQPESNAWEGATEGATTNWEEGVEEPKNDDIATVESAPAPEPEEVHKTLDEYRAEIAQKVLDIPLPEARKPNEGVDDSQWKDAVPLEKDEEEDFIFAGKEQSYRLKSKKSKSKNYLEITQTFVERPGGPSRGRGRGRGSRGGRGGRDDRDGRNNYRDNYDDNNRDNRRRGGGGGGGRSGVNLDDQRAFPSLGA